jgi:hypothetical protein
LKKEIQDEIHIRLKNDVIWNKSKWLK